MRLALAAVALVACSDPPPLTIQYALATNEQVCQGSAGPAQSCSDVALPCPMYLSLRIVDPANPTHAYLSSCEPVTGRLNLCSIAGVNLPTGELPAQTLEVEVALYPKSEVTGIDENLPVCPDDPAFANGLPVPDVLNPMPPAIGGAAYYHPGDEKTTVALGCMNQFELDTCVGLDSVAVTASAVDFNTDLAVSSTLADELSLFVGEPKVPPDGTLGEFALEPGQTTALARAPSSVPSWIGSVTQAFDQFACAEVLDESTTQITPVLTCQKAMSSTTNLDFAAVRIMPATLSQLLQAATMQPGVPELGITIGIVLDITGQPASGAQVTASDGTTVQYVTADRLGLVPVTMPQQTTVNGIFVDAQAGFGTTFVVGTSTPIVVGGRVDGKVTAVVLQYTMPMGN